MDHGIHGCQNILCVVKFVIKDLTVMRKLEKFWLNFLYFCVKVKCVDMTIRFETYNAYYLI